MAKGEILRIYLDPATLARARAGEHNFFRRLTGAVEGAGWRVDLLEATLAHRLAAPARDGYALWHMEAPPDPRRALTCRRCYIGAFWTIEAQAERWLRPVAADAFRPEAVDPAPAEAFARRWRRQLFPDDPPPGDDGFVFAPLQGRLLEKRAFQAASPVEMLAETLSRTGLPVRATLHPGEAYSDDEMLALGRLAEEWPGLSVERGGSGALLRRARMVVTENSGLALEGFFLRKPAILFARIDFHHIAASVPRDGIEAAFQPRPTPDFDRYLYWFLQMRAINAGRPECEAQILAALRGHGWPI